MSGSGTLKTRPSQEFLRAERAAKFILARTKLRPRVGLVLGSGLGAFANELASAARIGRVHFYEGYTPQRVIFPMRVMARMGVRAVLITNAAGGINLNFKQGCLVVLRDHINLQGTNPLIGPNEDRFGVRFPDLTQVYWKPYQAAALQQGKRLGVEMAEGVYAALTGPSYETPAEIRYLRSIGADLVGMSTVPEVIAAAHLGIRVLGISCVTNMAAGILDQPITTEEVLETGERVKADFVALLRAVIPRMNEDLP